MAARNFMLLAMNSYTGRGLIIGQDTTGRFMVQLYWIMGRSSGSRNRVLLQDERGRIYTEPADPAKESGDTKLTLYNAMAERCTEYAHLYVVSNGAQTDTVILERSPEQCLPMVLHDWTFEPDTPIFTPRITGLCIASTQNCQAQFHIIRKPSIPHSPKTDDRAFYSLQTAPGFGYCLTTYEGDGNPPPHFYGEPYLMPLEGDIVAVAETYSKIIMQEHGVSLAVKFIDRETRASVTLIKNKYSKVF